MDFTLATSICYAGLLPETSTKQKRNESYKEALNTFRGRQGYQIYRSLLDFAPGTSRELSARTGFDRTSICGRLNELVKNNLVYVVGDTFCEKTGKRVSVYAARPSFLTEVIEEASNESA